MRAALLLRKFRSSTTEILHDEGTVLGVQPGGQSDDEPCPPETARGGWAIADGILRSSGEVAKGVIFKLRHVNRRESTGAQEPSQVRGITAVGFDPVAGVVRNHGRGDDPARLFFVRQVAGEPVPTGPGFIPKDHVLGWDWERADAVIEVTRTRANRPTIGDLHPVRRS
jgi:hypothetical protein